MIMIMIVSCIYIYSPIETFYFFRIDHVIISTINSKLMVAISNVNNIWC